MAKRLIFLEEDDIKKLERCAYVLEELSNKLPDDFDYCYEVYCNSFDTRTKLVMVSSLIKNIIGTTTDI